MEGRGSEEVDKLTQCSITLGICMPNSVETMNSSHFEDNHDDFGDIYAQFSCNNSHFEVKYVNFGNIYVNFLDFHMPGVNHDHVSSLCSHAYSHCVSAGGEMAWVATM